MSCQLGILKLYGQQLCESMKPIQSQCLSLAIFMNLSERKIYKSSWMLLPFAFKRFTFKSPCLHFYKPPPTYLPHIMLSAKRADRHSVSLIR